MITTIDFAILDWIAENMRCGFLDFLMPVLSHICDLGIIWILVGLALVCNGKTRRLGLMMILALGVNLVICNGILKPLVARPRPCVVRDVTLLISVTRDFSFPSGHTSASFAAVVPLLMEKAKGRWPACLVAGLIGLSRLYLYVHYPSDVLGGAIVGALCGVLAVLILRKCMEKPTYLQPDEE